MFAEVLEVTDEDPEQAMHETMNEQGCPDAGSDVHPDRRGSLQAGLLNVAYCFAGLVIADILFRAGRRKRGRDLLRDDPDLPRTGCFPAART